LKINKIEAVNKRAARFWLRTFLTHCVNTTLMRLKYGKHWKQKRIVFFF